MERKAERMQAARDRPQRFWSGLSTVGSVGWMVVLPTAGGALVGHLIDRRLDSGVTYGLAGLVFGLAVGGYTAWRYLLRGLK